MRKLITLVIGFGCMIGYVRLVSLGFVGYLDQGTVESVDPWYLLRSCTTIAALVALAIWGLAKRINPKPLYVVAATACAVAAAVLFAIGGKGAMGPVIAVLEGLASAVLMYAWMLLLSRQTINVIIGTCVIGGGISGLIIAGVPTLDEMLAIVVAAIAALVAGSAILLADRELESLQPDGLPTKSELTRVPWVTVVMVLACGFFGTAVFGVAMRLAWLHDWVPNYIAFSVAILATIVATLVIMLRSRSWMHVVWIPITVLLAIALGFACIAMRESMQIALGLVLASVFCGRYLYWMVFPAMFSTLRIPHSFMTGIILVLANGSLAVMAGDALGAAMPRSMQNLGGVAGIVILALVVLFAVTFLVYRSAFGTVGYRVDRAATATGFLAASQAVRDGAPMGWDGESARVFENTPPDALQAVADDAPGAAEDGEVGEEDDSADALTSRVQGSASEYGLTPRETEVAILTAQGFSCAYIAEKLVVSNSTVRFHQQNIYRKYDVHSRNELIEFFLNDSPSDQRK